LVVIERLLRFLYYGHISCSDATRAEGRKGAFHFFAQIFSERTGLDGRRLRKGLCQE